MWKLVVIALSAITWISAHHSESQPDTFQPYHDHPNHPQQNHYHQRPPILPHLNPLGIQHCPPQGKQDSYDKPLLYFLIPTHLPHLSPPQIRNPVKESQNVLHLDGNGNVHPVTSSLQPGPIRFMLIPSRLYGRSSQPSREQLSYEGGSNSLSTTDLSVFGLVRAGATNRVATELSTQRTVSSTLVDENESSTDFNTVTISYR